MVDVFLMIEVDGVTKKYGNVKVINDMSFKVGNGEVAVLFGPNGSGKTTMLKSILGLLKFSGNIIVDGFDVKRKGKEVRRIITYVPQQFSFYNNLNVIENMKFYADIRGINREIFLERFEKLDLDNIANKRLGNLSEGLQQKIMLATALLADSPVLLFDEPTTNLDIKSILELKEIIKEYIKKGKTILLSTHLLSQIKDIVSKVIVINQGKLLFEGHVDDLLERIGWSNRIILTLQEELKPELIDQIKELLSKVGVISVSTEDKVMIVSSGTSNNISILKIIEEKGVSIKDIRIVEPNLEEEVFLKIIGENK